jgi:hypothetical protein
MIIRIDRLQTAMPPPSDPDPIGASAVQELLGVEEIAAKLRETASFSMKPTGVVAQNANGACNGYADSDGVMEKVKVAIN